MAEGAPRWTCACGRRCVMEQPRCPSCGGARTTVITTAPSTAVLAPAAVAAAASAAPRPPSGRAAAAPPTKAPHQTPRSTAPAPAPPRPAPDEDMASADLSAYASDEPAPNGTPASSPAPASAPPSAPAPVKSPPAAPVYPPPEAPARSSSARFSRPVEQAAAAAPEPAAAQRPRTQTFGPPPSASRVSTPRGALAADAAAVGEIGKLFQCFGTVMVRGGPLAAGMALVTAPIAALLAGLAIYVTAHLGLIVFIFTVFNAISLAIAVTIAGPLATFLIASTEESPKPEVVLKLALTRAPSLAWFILVMFFIQIAIGIPVYLAFGSSGPLIGSILGFFVIARFWTLGVGYTVAFNAPFGETLTKVMALGQGRFPLLCVAAGIPRVLQTLIGQFGATWV